MAATNSTADFREWRSIDELAEEQGIVAPQPLDSMIGAAADLWDSEEDFERFVNRGSADSYRVARPGSGVDVPSVVSRMK